VATTDSRLAAAAIGALDRSGVGYAVLHGEERLVGAESAPAGDTDLVVDRPPHAALAAARTELAHVGLSPVLRWIYDIGGTVTVFLADALGTRAVQLDLLFDPAGVGRYRMSSTRLLGYRQLWRGTHVVAPEAQVVYLWRKRSAKQQVQWLAEVGQQAETLDREALRRCALDLVGTSLAADEILAGRPARTSWPSPRRIVLHGHRVLTRLRQPAGFWLHLTDGSEQEALPLHERFATIFPHATVLAPRGGRRRSVRYAARAAWARLRPGLVITFGPLRALPGVRPDAVMAVAGRSLDETARLLVSAMAERLRS
jgi:hypothetical protein